MRINVYFKVLAVVLAVFVWFLARKSGEPIQMSFYAPVVFKNISPSFQVTSDPPQVNIVVYTNSRDSFNPQEIQAVIDLDKAQEGTLSYVLTENHILSPVKVEITRIHPSQITVRIEELIEKSFSIKPRYQGTPKKGYLMRDIRIIPDTLTMRGHAQCWKNLTMFLLMKLSWKDLKKVSQCGLIWICQEAMCKSSIRMLIFILQK